MDISKPYPRDILKDGYEIERWELKPKEPIKIQNYFSPIAGAYVEEITIKDPYCGSGDKQIEALKKFTNIINRLAAEIKQVRIYSREQNIKNYNYELLTRSVRKY